MRTYLVPASLAAVLLLAATPGLAGYDEGVAAFKAGNYSAAAKEFEPLAQSQPEVLQYQLMLGQSYLALNRAGDAITHLRKAYDLNPGEVSIRLPLAQAYAQGKRYNDALKLLKTIDPGKLSARQQQAYYQLRAKALDETGDTDALLQDLRAAARTSPNNATTQLNLGKACLSARDASCAVTALEAAVRLSRGDTDVKRILVKAYILQGRSSQGTAKRAAYSKAAVTGKELVAASASYDNLLLLGEAQLGAKEYGPAAQTLDRAAQAKSAAWLPLYYKGQAQTNLGQLESAETTLKTALGKTSSSTDQNRIWSQLGFVYEKQKSFDEAIAAYRKIGDSRSIARVEENRRIAEENREVEEYNQQIEELEKERQKLEEELSDLPPDLR